jgi:hypothetical protein
MPAVGPLRDPLREKESAIQYHVHPDVASSANREIRAYLVLLPQLTGELKSRAPTNYQYQRRLAKRGRQGGYGRKQEHASVNPLGYSRPKCLNGIRLLRWKDSLKWWPGTESVAPPPLLLRKLLNRRIACPSRTAIPATLWHSSGTVFRIPQLRAPPDGVWTFLHAMGSLIVLSRL